MVLSFDILSDLIINEVTFVTKAYNEVGSGGKRVSRERWAIIHKFEGETSIPQETEAIFPTVKI